MDITEITAPRLKQALNAFQQAQPPPAELLTLDVLHEFNSHSSAEKQIHLHDWLEKTVLTHLAQYRAVEVQPLPIPKPLTRQQITAVLATDFSHNNLELEAWSALYHRYFIPMSITVNELAQAASVVPRHFSRRLQTGLDLLVDVVRREEMAAHGRFHAQHLRRHLPPPDYDQLFGSESLLQQVNQLMQQENGSRLISLEGLGGMGKTALARAFANQMAETGDLDGIIWISARHEWLTAQGDLQPVVDPARSLSDIVTRLAEQVGQTELAGLSVSEKLERLQPVLAASSHLVIIDNLETLDDLTLLLPILATLKDTARFLLTSRHTLSRYPFVHCLPVPPLSLADSRILLESELVRRGRNEKLKISKVVQLHDLIGGVPLALKLTAAQLAHLPLDEVIDGLQQANQQSSERLFTYIYHRTWQLLDKPAKALLLSLLSISPDGENIGWLRLMSGLPEDDFAAALTQLTEFSLLQIAGSPTTPIYRLHRLTTTFLQTEILLNWSN
ncbi:MAG: hypothetical protein IAF02_26505, partial [Anaerolineae bacterium]|nr:hypothetical protein [Anaerolineae bacterium]